MRVREQNRPSWCANSLSQFGSRRSLWTSPLNTQTFWLSPEQYRFFTTGLSGESPESVFLIKGLSVPGSNQSNHLASSGSVLMLVGVWAWKAGLHQPGGSFSIRCSRRCRARLRVLSTCSSAESGRVSASQLEFVKLSEIGDLKRNKKTVSGVNLFSFFLVAC